MQVFNGAHSDNGPSRLLSFIVLFKSMAKLYESCKFSNKSEAFRKKLYTFIFFVLKIREFSLYMRNSWGKCENAGEMIRRIV